MKGSFLAVSAAAVGLAAAISACGGSSSPASPPPSAKSSASQASAATSAATSAGTSGGTSATGGATSAAPAGYQRIGGSAQGVSLAIPSSWVTVDLAEMNVKQAEKQMQIKGVSSQTVDSSLQSLKKMDGLMAEDGGSAASAPGHFATNLNAYCLASGVNESGSAGLSAMRQAITQEFEQDLHAQHIKSVDANLGGVPGLKTSYTVQSVSAGTLHATQLEVLPRAGRACYVTVTAAGQVPSAVVQAAESTMRYS
jgi:hypothetical protein